MISIGMILSLVGGVIALVGFIWVVILAFKQSILWGLACIIPCVQIIFAIMHWEKARKPFLIALGGTALCSLGSYLTRGAAG